MYQVHTPFHYFDPTFPDSVVVLYLPSSQNNNSVVSITDYNYSYSSAEKQYIRAQKIRKQEDLASVLSVNEKNGNVTVCKTDYRSWKAIATPNSYNLFKNPENIPNALHVQALIQTADNKLIFGTRPNDIRLQIPSGMLNWSDLTQPNSLTYAALREFHEECADIPVINPSIIGTTFYKKRVLTSISVTGQIDLTAHELSRYRFQNKQKIKDFSKFSKTKYFDASQDAIERTVTTDQLNLTALAALLLLGHQKFGVNWLQKHRPPQIIFSKQQENQHLA